MSSGIKSILLLLFIPSMESLHDKGEKTSLSDKISMITDFNLKLLLFSVNWLKHDLC